ncbi:hypothetical protein HCN44_009929 [Aphidius gifuensis]|uniref:Uncharacterized protein n=1 Tax=Aphidius gifuensis TaxID=684658 RepID=A0A835CW75_APHGI|nr:hypothetical protein HCN44_009929 [Aphidius gifuensis]
MDTYPARHALLKSGISVHDYFGKFAPLALKIGRDLLLSDFDFHPNVHDTLLIRWPTVRKHLINRLQQFKITNDHDKDLASSLPQLAPENADAVILYLLPYLVDSDTRKKKSSSSVDPNSPAQDINAEIEKRKDTLLESGLTLQPMPILVGPLDAIEAVYVQVLSHRYEADSTVHGIDLAFKIFTALDCNYPEQSHSLWTVFQVACFGIKNSVPTRNRSANALIREILKLEFPEPDSD